MDIPQLITAISQVAWPVLVTVLLWRLFPLVREIASSRAFSIKFGDMEVSVQQASDQLRIQVEDLQKQVAILRKQLGEPSETVVTKSIEAMVEPAKEVRRILWVDDKPSNNAYEIAKLQDDGIQIVQARSTAEGMRILTSGRPPVDLVISDMGRQEEEKFEPRAGIKLIEEMRRSQFNLPIMVYGSAKYLEQNRRDVLAAGGNGMTASPVELFEMIEKAGSEATARR